MAFEFPTCMVERPEVILHNRSLNEDLRGTAKQLEDVGLTALLGFNDHIRKQILSAAYDPVIREYCPNDISRFGSYEAGAKWASKGRVMIPVVNDTGRLMAYGWAGPEKNDVLPDAPITTAYRVTEAGRKYAAILRERLKGFHLGLPLGRLVIGAAEQFGAERSDISLETWKSNVKALRLYRQLGFELRDESPSDYRATLKAIGEKVNGYTVREGMPERGLLPHTILDQRLHFVLGE